MKNVENGHVVDASQSRERVADQVVEVATRYLACRVDSRLGIAGARPVASGRSVVDSAVDTQPLRLRP